jgi:hypothetical protein
MKWLLAKIFLGQLLLLSLSAVLIVVLHMEEMTDTQRQYTSLIARGPLLLAAERLHALDSEQRGLELLRLTEMFGYPVRLLEDETLHAEITAVDPAQLQPIRRELELEGVSALAVPPDFSADERALLRFEPGQVLVFGPIPNPFEAPAADLLQWSQLVLLAAVLMIGLLPTPRSPSARAISVIALQTAGGTLWAALRRRSMRWPSACICTSNSSASCCAPSHMSCALRLLACALRSSCGARAPSLRSPRSSVPARRSTTWNA